MSDLSSGVSGLAEETLVSDDDWRRRIIEPSEFVADRAAFVDVRLPRSQGKASYSMIGPGVSQNAGQTVNLAIPHGFNIGAADMPAGVVNNAHLHYTAEVFVCTRGSWRFAVGRQGEQTIDVGPGDVFSAPTWVFRGFENTGEDDGWLFVVLGHDDTGGIIWAPEILEAAAETGLYLGADHSVIDVGDGPPPSAELVAPLSDAALAAIDHYDDEALAACNVKPGDLAWSERALLGGMLDGPAVAIAPVIGWGMTEDRSHRPPLTTPHGFSLEWLRLDPGAETGTHRLRGSQVLLLVDGDWELSVNTGADARPATPAAGSVVSVPTGAWRNFRNYGDTAATAVVVCADDGPSRIEWTKELTAAAAGAGWGLDASGYLAPIELLGPGRK
ncbi:MAG: cupin domain-containing protein [Actinomycetota bacterium]